MQISPEQQDPKIKSQPLAPLVSVIVPTRNRPELLLEAVGSINSQKYRPLECLVVDDASDPPVSRPGLSAVFPALELRTVRLDRRGGTGRAMNTGLEEAHGVFVLILDDDDLLLPEALSRLVSGLQAHDQAVAAVCGVEVFGSISGGESVVAHPPWVGKDWCGDVYWDVLYGLELGGQGILYRTEVLRSVGGFVEDVEVGEDWLTGVRVASQGDYLLVSDRLYSRRWRPWQSAERLKSEFAEAEELLSREAQTWTRDHSRARLPTALRARSRWQGSMALLEQGNKWGGIAGLAAAVLIDPGLLKARLFWRLSRKALLDVVLRRRR